MSTILYNSSLITRILGINTQVSRDYLGSKNSNFLQNFNRSSNYTLGIESIKQSSWPVFAADQYISPRAQNGSVVCANCHTYSRDIEVSLPQAVRLTSTETFIDSSLRIKVDALSKQVATTGKSAGLNMSGVGVFPYGFRIESDSSNTDREEKVLPYAKLSSNGAQASTDNENVTPLEEQDDTRAFVFNVQRAYDNLDTKSGGKHYPHLGMRLKVGHAESLGFSRTTEVLLGGVIGRGQIFPSGEPSNSASVSAPIDGRVYEIFSESGQKQSLSIRRENGNVVLLDGIPELLELKVKAGQLVSKGEPLTGGGNPGGIGQLNRELSIQEHVRLKSIILVVLWCTLAQHSMIIKRKQFIKVQELQLCG
jgi:apocytochrome f